MKWTSRALSLILLFSSTAVYAKWYHVEAIIFEHVDPRAISAEVWQQNAGMPNLSKALEIQTDKNTADKNLLIRPQDTWQLKETVRRLRNDRRFHVIQHTAWQQSLEQAGTGQAVHLRSGTRFDLPNDSSLNANQVPPGVAIGQGAGPFPLDGTLEIRLNKFLQVKTDLVLTKSVVYNASNTLEPFSLLKSSPWYKNSDAKLWGFRLARTKKIRSNELHYLDHPLFGVIIKITALEGEKSVEADVIDAPESNEEID